MIHNVKFYFQQRYRVVIAAAVLVFFVAPAQSMPSNNTVIVPILQLLFGDDVDPNLPVANAGPDAQVLVGELVQLDGSGSADPNALPVTFAWSFQSKPTASVATLNFRDIVNPEFVVDVPGAYVLQLVINNGLEDSLPDTVTITNTNRIPLADAGDNAVVSLAEAVTLDGTGSSDIDTDPLMFNWVVQDQPVGSIAQFDDATLESPTFTPDMKGNYVIDLVVNDGQVDSEVDQVEILAGVEVAIDIDDVFFGIGRETTATISLDLPVPAEGIVIALRVDENIIGISESELNFNEGETEKTITLTGLQVGTTSLTASGANIDEVTVNVEVSGALISIDEIEPLSPSGSRSVAISLSDAAPLGGLTITLESLDIAVATVSPASLFIAQGQFVPAENAQLTGISLGTTTLRATAVGFAPDERDVEVALAANFEQSSLSVPETLSREIVLELDAPAPQSGVTFSLSVIGDANFSFPDTITIEDGQTQSLPIILGGLSEGVSILRASAVGFVDAEAQITVVDAPNVFLLRNGSNAHLVEAEIGFQLQDVFRVRLEIPPISAVDILISVPEDSGVLISSSNSTEGSNSLLIEDQLSVNSPSLFLQGIEIGDDVPLSIEVVKANTDTPAGYEALLSTVDVDPSGVFLSTADFETTTFNMSRTVVAQAALLHDEDSSGEAGTVRQNQPVRGGGLVQIPIQVDNTSILTLSDGATGFITLEGNNSFSSINLSPLSNGVATVSIASQPAGFSLPSNRDDEVQVTITAPDAFLNTVSSSSHLVEAVVGLDLQRRLRVRFETAPPSPVDVQISVGAGALISSDVATAGSSSILLEDVSSSITTFFFLQGLALGDDVPITINVFNANTNTPVGYNILSSTVDVDPAGLFVTTSDYTTTTFSNNRTVSVSSAVLFDDETPANQGNRFLQQGVRGGLDLAVPMQVSDALVASLPNGENDNLIISAGSTSGGISVEPVGAGQATVSIATLPREFSVPANSDDNVIATVTAPNAFLSTTSGSSFLAEAIIGVDLQAPFRIRLGVSPPSPVDVVVSVPDASGVLLSAGAEAAGSSSIIFAGVTNAISPLFFIQGTSVGDDVPVTINVFEENTTIPIGYNVLSSTVDVDPSGVYMSTADYETNTFANNRLVSVVAAVLFDNEASAALVGRRRTDQLVRGGAALSVPMAVGDATVVVLPGGATDSLVIAAGQSNSSIAVDPQTAGVATVSIAAQPNANFMLPIDRDDEVLVTVTAPDARFNLSSILVGDELQVPVNVTLQEVPLNPVDVTVEISSSAVALVSDDGTVEGSATVIFENVTTNNVGTIFIQGLTLDAATQVKVSAPGYNDGTSDIQVDDSGFSLLGSFADIDVSETRNLSVRSERLNDNGSFAASQAVRGGVSFDLVLTSSVPSVGTITSPITLTGGDFSKTSEFTAITTGTTTLEITQPTGFTPPVGRTDGEITVE